MIQQETNCKTDVKLHVKQTQNRRKMFRVSLAFLFSVIFALPFRVEAARLYFEPALKDIKTDVKIGESFTVNLMLDPQDEDLNALEGRIVFSENLKFIFLNDAGSLVSLWIQKPELKTQNSEFYIPYSGIMPGGYLGELNPYGQGWRPGRVFSAVFQAVKPGTAQIKIEEARTLLNDGKGTQAKLAVSDFRINVLESRLPAEEILLPKIEDIAPPEPFGPEIASDPNIFDGKHFLVFVAQDKETGISYYAIRETRRETKRETDAKWIEAESPYVLKDQKLRSFIYVKAVDKAGNERIAMISPKYPLRWYEKYENWIIIIIGVILAAIFFRILWRRYAKIHEHQHKITRNF